MSSGTIKAFAVSTAVGSGKTRAAVAYIASKPRQNFIYVAPTIRLTDQVAGDLRTAIRNHGSERDVSLVHSESSEAIGVPIVRQIANTLNGASDNSGAAVVVTTTTFLRVLSLVDRPEHWAVIVDEGFNPVQFEEVHLGQRGDRDLAHFLEVFTFDRGRACRVNPAAGQARWVGQLASQGVARTGDRDAYLRRLAAQVANPFVCCELVLTPPAKAVLDAIERGDIVSAPIEQVLEVACYATPEWIPRFAEVILMSALFEKTMLCLFWSKVFGVTFEEHPDIRRERLRNIHVDEGPRVRVGHLLHSGDRSSTTNLSRNRHTKKENEREPGERVIDRLVELASEHFKPSTFLLQTNKRYGYEGASPLMPANAVKVPTHSHGLNDFANHHNVAALAVTNPTPSQGRWIMDKAGLDSQTVHMAFRLHTTYQAVGRSSVRESSATDALKTFLTVGEVDAEALHNIFEGSEWLGQVGGMEPLASADPEASRPQTEAEQLGELIAEHLNRLPLETMKVSSRSLKALLANDASSSTWTRAVDEAMAVEWLWGWVRDGQSVRRMTATDYGFEVEDASSIASTSPDRLRGH